MEDFNKRHSAFDNGNARLYVDDAITSGLAKEIYLDANFKHYPLRHFNEMINTLSSVAKDYDKLNRRNRKKDEKHLNKHAMHLIRLFMMGIDILEKGEIITHRKDEDFRLLRRIRGDYMENGKMTSAFYDLVSFYEERLHEATRKSLLPDEPDMEKIEAFLESINKTAIIKDR